MRINSVLKNNIDHEKEVKDIKRIPGFLYILLAIIYLEVVFSIMFFQSIEGILWKIAFSIPIATVIYVLSGLGKEKVNKIVATTILFILCFIFSAQVVYYSIYDSFLSFYSIFNGAGQVMQFVETIFEKILNQWFNIILLFIPLILWFILLFRNNIILNKQKRKGRIKKIIFFIVFQIIVVICVNISFSNDVYSAKNLYYNTHAPILTIQKFGLCSEMRLDFQRLVFGFEEKDIGGDLIIDEPTTDIPQEKEVEYNIMNIDFESLIANETNKDIIGMHEYFMNQEPSKKNEYTGMFKDKNLIVFVCEAFSSMAIREDITPNLYRLYKEGFQFENFYTPVFPVSTADGEYITDTSLIPKEGVWSLKRLENHYMPFSYANIFEKLGYSSNAYHNHTAKYYGRDLYINAMGYNSYLAVGNGLEERMVTKYWPNSDYEMIKATTDDYINNDNFVAYYMTVSGHLNYNRTGNMMVSWNWDTVKDLPYSETAKCYLATEVELDKAIGELITRLEAVGKLDDTVIMMSADHYPYGLTLDEINELSTYERDDNFEKYHMPFLLWSGSMTEPIKVEKYGSSLDMVPTILNLFGVEFDSRLLMGRDILSDTNPLVIYSNRSFITDLGRYNAKTKSFIPVEGLDIPENYTKQISNQIYNKYKYSRLILENDYYRYLGI